jgi:hypothetical protein
MGLDFGWRANDVRETIWIEDSALVNVPPGVIDDWRADGDASHLRPYATAGQPEVFTFRTLTQDEAHYVRRFAEGEGDRPSMSALARVFLASFRIGVEFPTGPESLRDQAGARHSRTARERGIRMLNEEFVEYLARRYPGIVAFYGNLIFAATFATDAEKKASSPPSTPPPSSVEVAPKDDTAGRQGAALQAV